MASKWRRLLKKKRRKAYRKQVREVFNLARKLNLYVMPIPTFGNTYYHSRYWLYDNKDKIIMTGSIHKIWLLLERYWNLKTFL